MVEVSLQIILSEQEEVFEAINDNIIIIPNI